MPYGTRTPIKGLEKIQGTQDNVDILFSGADIVDIMAATTLTTPQKTAFQQSLGIVAGGGSTIVTISGTTATLSSANVELLHRTTNGSAITITVPNDATDPIGVGASWVIVQAGAGAPTLSPQSPVTINKKAGRAGTLNGAMSGVTLTKVAANTFDLIGDYV